MKKTILRQYARLIARVGVNIQKGQEVFILAELDQPEFVTMLVDECYKCKAKKVVETIEAELADIEKRIAEYDARFAAATEYNEADYKAYNELKTRYDHQMHEWEKASYELEIIENE